MNVDLAKKIGFIGAGVIFVGVFFMYDLGQFLTLEYIKASQAKFVELSGARPFLVMGVYLLLYILVTALSLPGAVIMTLAGGGLFGLWKGLILVSFASTIGATCACFAARFILQDWVQKRFADKLLTINKGVEEEGAFYLFTLRLVPVFPFFIINLVMGLTTMRLSTFFWVSQLGMLPGTLVFVNAGKELAGIDSLAGILSPGLIVSFVILGVFPLAVKKVMGLIRKHKQTVV